MPASNFKIEEQWLKMPDSRLVDLIDYCDRFLAEFMESESDRDKLSWMSDAISKWKEECRLPPGCVIIRIDPWLKSSVEHFQLARLFAFVAKKIRTTMPSTEAVMANEAERVEKFVLETAGRFSGGMSAPSNQN